MLANAPAPPLMNGNIPSVASTMNPNLQQSTDAMNTISSAGVQPGPKHIWLVTGPAGCGKTTVAVDLAKKQNLPYLEGDSYHPAANIEKMGNGIPLTDADRWDWLTLLREEALRQLASGAQGVVLTCSALKRKYRDVLRVAPYFSHDIQLHFIYLSAPEALLLERVGQRQGHYMGANMVHSQFEILEPPTAEETDVISIDVSGPIAGVLDETTYQVNKKISEPIQQV